MKLRINFDVHSNYEVLKAVLRELNRKGVNRIKSMLVIIRKVPQRQSEGIHLSLWKYRTPLMHGR